MAQVIPTNPSQCSCYSTLVCFKRITKIRKRNELLNCKEGSINKSACYLYRILGGEVIVLP